MTLDRQSRALLDSWQDTPSITLDSFPVDEARRGLREVFLSLAGPRLEVGRREETTLPGPGGEIPVRLYWPGGESRGAALPAIVFIHGGGWVLGDLDCYENLARFLSARAGVVVCSVDYRLAPEHKYPAGLEDVCAAAQWLGANAADLGIDANRIGLAGDSAGGNLCAAACLTARDGGAFRVAGQILLYPVLCANGGEGYSSRARFGDGDYFLSRAALDWSVNSYLESTVERTEPLVSPILAADLAGLPPTVIVTAGHDPLRDEGLAYADRLRVAGVSVAYRCFDGTIHGFLSFGAALDVAKEGLNYVAGEARRILA